MSFDSSRYFNRLTHLKNERSSFDSHWVELADAVSPRQIRSISTDRNKGDRRNKKIVQIRPTLALRTLSSGLMSGITSPSRPWFRVALSDRELMEVKSVKDWLDKAEKVLLQLYSESNFYQSIAMMYRDVGLFGTAAMTVFSDFEDGIIFEELPIGSYFLGQNSRRNIDTIYREFEMQVSQVVEKFGLREDGTIDWKNISISIKNLYENRNFDAWVPVLHVIEPNKDRDESKSDNQNLEWKELYLEKGNDTSGPLKVSGYHEFPVIVARWLTYGQDVYAVESPGMDALGDCKGLQIQEREKAKALAKMVSPPMQGPSALKNRPISTLPNGATLYDQNAGQGIKPIYQVDPRIQEVRVDQSEREGRINEAFYVDLFRAISSMDGVQPRNQMELSQRNQERLLELGPALQQLHRDVLDRLIDRTFNIAMRSGLIPEAPQEIQGIKLKIDYISVLAQAQQASETVAIERIASFIGEMSSVFPSVVDKFDSDQAVDEYAWMIGVPGKVIKSDEDVDKIRQERVKQQQEQQQQQQQLEQADIQRQGADTAKVLSETEVGAGQNALSRMIGDL